MRACTSVTRGIAPLAASSPVLHQECPTCRAPPAAGNLDVTAGVAFAREASSADQRDRRRVPWLHVGLDAMQSQGTKTYAQHQRESLAHVTLAGMFREPVITKIGASKRAADDLAE